LPGALLSPDKGEKHALTADGSGHRVELGAQIGAQGGDRANDYHGDQGHQQAIFHRAGPGLILKKIF